jgi:pimeloyl-ACP methyl ester carboxylesterase
MIKKTMLFLLALGAIHCRGSELADLKAVFRNGQVFLQWQEKDLPKDCRLAVWSSSAPITKDNVKQALCVADLLNTQSAADWWLDASNFLVKRSKKIKADEPFANTSADLQSKAKKRLGFIISDGGAPIPADGGLHVHTPRPGETGMRYFAVSAEFKGKNCGFTALSKPIEVGAGKSSPIALKKNFLKKNSCKGLPLIVELHGRGGGVGVDGKGRALGTHIIYSSRDFAWREGIPFKFTISKDSKEVRMYLNDRIWIGRIMDKSEISDGRDRVKAISTFWFGYNPGIARSIKGPKYVCDNYTERYILHLVRWAQEYLGTDPAATYVSGGSMGGSGAIQLATRYPEVFAAAAAWVPVYSYTWKKIPTDKNSKGPRGFTMTRLICSIGKFSEKNPAVLPDGSPLQPLVDGAKNINRPGVDITPIFATNGRQDMSIHWVNNPPFYRAANAARQAFSVYWNNGGHAMSGKAPGDMATKSIRQTILNYRLDKSYPAFSNCSDNKNYGNGDPTDGDLQGWINRGFSWNVLKDTPERYEIAVSVNYPGIVYPVYTDMTLRRRQQFKPAAGTVLKVQINGKESKIKVDENALVTIEKIAFDNQKPLHVVITR